MLATIISIATDVFQSKKLVELGIDQNTADMFWTLNADNVYRLGIWNNREVDLGHDIPAWSLSSLMSYVTTLDHYKDKFIAIWSNGVAEHREIDSTPVDAVFKMVVWLKENKFI